MTRLLTPGKPDEGRAGTAAAVLALLALLACLLLGGLGVAWRVSGGSWAVITSPSMGIAAPVGTLILTRSVQIETLRVGDVVTYRPRNEQDKRYTHRVVATYPDDTVQVRGDINGAADPLPVAQGDLVGRVDATWPGVGWLVRALPTLMLANVVLFAATGLYVPARWRSSARVVGVCLVFALSVLLLRPFVHPILIAVTDHDSSSVASVVSGGLFPTTVTGAPGHTITLTNGQTGTVPVAATTAGGPVTINGSPNLHGWWRVGTIVFCLLPMAWCTLIGLAPQTSRQRELDEHERSGRRPGAADSGGQPGCVQDA